MANPVILNNETHRKIRVITTRGAEFGENIHMVPVIGGELTDLVLDFPVYLVKNKETGELSLNALMGFEPGENLYLQGDKWAASYLPLHMRRQPFLLAHTGDQNQTKMKNEALMAIDMDSKRVSESQGEALFNEDGSKTPYMDGIASLLAALAADGESTEAFIAALVEHELIESAQLNVTFANGEKKTYKGIYTVNANKLFELKGEVLEQLNSNGFLQACYMLVASMGQISRLIKLKNSRP